MKEIIQSITEVFGHKYENTTYDGWVIKTSEQEVLCLVDDGQSCCES